MGVEESRPGMRTSLEVDVAGYGGGQGHLSWREGKRREGFQRTQGSRAWHPGWMGMSTDLKKAGRKAGFEGKMMRLVFKNVYLNLKSLRQSAVVSWENAADCNLRVVYCIQVAIIFTPVLLNHSPPLLPSPLPQLHLK